MEEKIKNFELKFTCFFCNYSTNKKVNYIRHETTRKHIKNYSNHKISQDPNLSKFIDNGEIKQLFSSHNNSNICKLVNTQNKASNSDNVLIPETIEVVRSIVCNKTYQYICELCDFYTNDKKKYNNHCTTNKHKKKIDSSAEESKNDITINKNFFMKIINDNHDLKQMLIEQNEKIIELSKNNNIITNNTNCINNQNFNLNFFLNEKCKDAINWTDFIDKIEISHKDLENNAQLGFVKGISKILIDNLNQLTLFERPIHCTDIKREIIYIKDEDEWKKEQDNKKIKNAIQEVSRKSICSLMEWKQDNPEYADLDSDFSQKCIVIQTQSVAGKQREEFYSKIKHNLKKEIIIDKC